MVWYNSGRAYSMFSGVPVRVQGLSNKPPLSLKTQVINLWLDNGQGDQGLHIHPMRRFCVAGEAHSPSSLVKMGTLGLQLTLFYTVPTKR